MDINFNKNEDHNKLLITDLKQKFAKIKLGGGEKRIEKLHSEGKMTARERIDYLLDTNARTRRLSVGRCSCENWIYQRKTMCCSSK
jgi:acetyl-CoA carboxylase carboxyltransferase component